MSSLSGTTSGTESARESDVGAAGDVPAPPAAAPAGSIAAAVAAGAGPGARAENHGARAEGHGVRPDVLLLRKAQAGDRGAYGQIVLLYQDRLYNAVLRLVGDREEARELTQEAFTRGLEKIDSFRGDAAPYTWLFRIAVNLAISQLRKVRRLRVFSLDRPGAGAGGRNSRNGRAGFGDDQAAGLVDRVARDKADTAADKLEKRERDQVVLAALGRLDAEYRAVLVMRDIEGFDYQQMADVLGLPLGTLKSRLFRARMALRDELKGYLS